MSNYVFLIDALHTPMNPIHPAHARELLEAGKAAVFRRYPVGVIQNLKILTTKILTVKTTGHGCRRMCRLNKFGFPCTAPKQIFTHVSTGDFVKVTLHKDRKNIPSGIYNCRVKTPTLEGCEVIINGFRVGFSTMKDVFKIHRNDGYSYA